MVHALSLLYSTGMHFSQAVAIIQHQVGTIRGVQVLYSDTVSISTILTDWLSVSLSLYVLCVLVCPDAPFINEPP